MSGGEVLVAALAREGVTHVFGVPGAGQYEAVDPFYGRRDIHYVSCRSEQPTTYLADGYGRVGGRPAAAIVLSGVGLRNAAPGVETAYASSSPLLIISDHEAGGDIPPALAGIVKWGGRAARPAELPELVRRALVAARSGRPRPVFLGVSHAVLAAREEVAWPRPAEAAASGSEAEGAPPGARDQAATMRGGAAQAAARAAAPGTAGATAVARAAALLAGAARPAIVAGTGVARAGAADALRTLAERLTAPVATSVAAKGVFSDRHPLCLGAVHPPYVPLTRFLQRRDVVLLAGTGMPAATLSQESGAQVVRVDVEPRDAATVTIQADAGWALEQLVERLPSPVGRATSAEVHAEVAAVRARRYAPAEQLEPQRSLTEALRAALPDDGILVHDMTQLGYYSRGYFPVYAADGYQIPRGNLGAALPLALGAKLASPQRAVVALCGDGGVLYHVQELATAVQYGIPVVVVVCNDHAYGNVLRAQQEQFAGREIGTRLHNPDFLALAAAFGISGQRAGDAATLRRALETALAAEAPALIEVPLGPLERRY